MNIHRAASAHLMELAKSHPALLVTGARQVGKTTLLTSLFPGAPYLTLDDPILAETSEATPEEFLGGLADGTILDEVQYAPGLFRHIKRWIDRDRRPGRLYLTGSQKFSLMQGVSESLAGRVGLLDLGGFTREELEDAGHGADLFDLVWRGGFPALHAGDRQAPHLWFPSYVATYLERDVRNLLSVHNLRDFARFLRVLALRSGQMLNFADLARDVGISPNTARSWYSVLETSGLAATVEPWYRNETKRIIRTPKAYLADTGLLCHLLGISSPTQMRASAHWGAIWETWAFTQIQGWFHNRGAVNPPIHWWRTTDGQEVDFVVESPRGLVTMECKAREATKDGDDRGLKAFEREHGKEEIHRAWFLTASRPHPSRSGGHVVNGAGLSRLFGE
ncbi:MAG TPA: ATP-binding protein [Fibrobacteria bacterium]|nr:ATP-binding protein [Fibrobacteria bacterium]